MSANDRHDLDVQNLIELYIEILTYNFARLDLVADHDMDAYIATMEHWLEKDK